VACPIRAISSLDFLRSCLARRPFGLEWFRWAQAPKIHPDVSVDIWTPTRIISLPMPMSITVSAPTWLTVKAVPGSSITRSPCVWSKFSALSMPAWAKVWKVSAPDPPTIVAKAPCGKPNPSTDDGCARE
jgi:hypothetical protein